MAGKWKVAELTPTRVDTPDGSISVSWVNNFDGGVRERRAEAVARLIAAAPDLLEACEAMIALRNSTEMTYEDAYYAMFKSEGRGAWEKVSAAIARATQPLPPPNEES